MVLEGSAGQCRVLQCTVKVLHNTVLQSEHSAFICVLVVHKHRETWRIERALVCTTVLCCTTVLQCHSATVLHYSGVLQCTLGRNSMVGPGGSTV